LPQFHPIAENDEWWGSGFTEWTNVVKAKPQFPGHCQPHVPSDLGYYDLRDPLVRQRQTDLAREAGVNAFAYYHYWFNGRRLLERPFDEILDSGEPDFPFILVWANENWTRRWDGGGHKILIGQHYSAEDDLAHIKALLPALRDCRYLTRDGKPIVAIYRSSLLPNALATTRMWRAEAQRAGLAGLYLLSVESAGDKVDDPRPLGFDAAVEFPPTWADLPTKPLRFIVRHGLGRFKARFSHHFYRYDEMAQGAMAKPDPPYPRWSGVTPGFDNTARRQRDATIFVASSPETYGRWLDNALQRSERMAATYEPGRSGLVFINAWNEWGEGNHLEPDQEHGHAYLDATKHAVERFNSSARE
jgi:lipopolysaccharide biosynthesis protein